MRDRNLHSILEAFTADAAARLSGETANGAEVPFEVVESEARRGRVPLYCYKPLTGEFIDERLGMLSGLATYSPAVRALAGVERADAYLSTLGLMAPAEERARADAVLAAFLRRVFEDRSEFMFDPTRFELVYQELELALFEARHVCTVAAVVLGLAFEATTPELALGDGLSLVRADKFEDPPPQAVWSERGEPHVLISLSVVEDGTKRPVVSAARTSFRRVLTALRLFEHGGYTLAPMGWIRVDAGPWCPVAMQSGGRPGTPTLIASRQEDELRAFCSLIARRAPCSGEVAWALARFEMGCERLAPFEALTDYLLALRALLEPEGPGGGRLPDRLAALCAQPEDRSALAERAAAAIALERAVIAGAACAEQPDALVEELGEHLRMLLRDVLCGHLDLDLVKLADALPARDATQQSASGGTDAQDAAAATPVETSA